MTTGGSATAVSTAAVSSDSSAGGIPAATASTSSADSASSSASKTATEDGSGTAQPDDVVLGGAGSGTHLYPVWEGFKAGVANLWGNTGGALYNSFVNHGEKLGAGYGAAAYNTTGTDLAVSRLQREQAAYQLVDPNAQTAATETTVPQYQAANAQTTRNFVSARAEDAKAVEEGVVAGAGLALDTAMVVDNGLAIKVLAKGVAGKLAAKAAAPKPQLLTQAEGFGMAAEAGPVSVPPASVRTPLPVAAEGELSTTALGEVAPNAGGNVNLASPQRTTHILDGDATGGGHLWPGQPGKTPFPQSWSRERIMHEVSDIASDPAQTWVQQTGKPGSLYTKAGDPARFVGIGERGGVRIKVVIEPAGEGIITALPIP